MENETLFENTEEKKSVIPRPLAYRIRPKSFNEFAGQEHILGMGKLLKRMILMWSLMLPELFL